MERLREKLKAQQARGVTVAQLREVLKSYGIELGEKTLRKFLQTGAREGRGGGGRGTILRRARLGGGASALRAARSTRPRWRGAPGARCSRFRERRRRQSGEALASPRCAESARLPCCTCSTEACRPLAGRCSVPMVRDRLTFDGPAPGNASLGYRADVARRFREPGAAVQQPGGCAHTRTLPPCGVARRAHRRAGGPEPAVSVRPGLSVR